MYPIDRSPPTGRVKETVRVSGRVVVVVAAAAAAAAVLVVVVVIGRWG